LFIIIYEFQVNIFVERRKKDRYNSHEGRNNFTEVDRSEAHEVLTRMKQIDIYNANSFNTLLLVSI